MLKAGLELEAMIDRIVDQTTTSASLKEVELLEAHHICTLSRAKGIREYNEPKAYHFTLLKDNRSEKPWTHL